LGFTNKLNNAIVDIETNNCDVIVFDLFINRNDPLANLKTLRNAFPKIPIVIYSVENSLLWKWRTLQEGAFGYVVKGWELEELVEVIRKSASGEITIPGDLSSLFQKMNFSQGLWMIKPEDLDIVRYRELGFQNKDIAIKLFKTVKSIEKSLQKLCITFDVEKVSDLIHFLSGLR